jgi:ATP-dependent RNA helicase DDX31/DBP7
LVAGAQTTCKCSRQTSLGKDPNFFILDIRAAILERFITNMADDGLLLNFAIGDDTLTSRSNLTGGTWRARRRVEKQEQHQANQGRPVERNDGQRPLKRQKISGPQDVLREVRSQPTSKGKPSQPRQVISSLFSFNPTPTTQAEIKDKDEPEQQVEPTNAPLTAEQEGLVKLGLLPNLAAHLTNKMNITAPTAIQKAAMVPLLEGDSDAFIQAETGSGKTLAYVLPIVQRIMQMTVQEKRVHRDSGLFALILAPTRELSKQISVVLENVLRCAHWVVPGIVIGGENKKSEKARLRKGVNILVATPGRLADHLEHTEALEVSGVRWLVLDEGDRLMELGFEEDIKKIVSKLDFALKAKKHDTTGLPPKRINILCSATMKMDVQRLGEISLKDAVHIQAESSRTNGAHSETEQKAFSAPAQLKQSYAIVPAKLRLVSLVSHLRRTFVRRGAVSKAIVFMSCADTVDFHFEIFTRAKVDKVSKEVTESSKDNKFSKDLKSRFKERKTIAAPAAEPQTSGTSPLISNAQSTVKVFKLHGSLPQNIRTQTLRAFSRETDPAVLVCTDVASRGLDLPNVDLVVEYDPPFSKEEHLHRIGRTARAGRDGRATIFLLPGCEEGYIDILKEGRQDGGIGLVRHVANDLLRKGFVMKDDHGREKEGGWEERATEWQLDIERWMLDSPKMLEMSRRAFQSHIRAYATHVAAERQIFDMKQLHLGHLCKAFGLRDKPGSINVPGLRQNAGTVKSERQKSGGGKTREDGSSKSNKRGADAMDAGGDTDAEQARRMMRAKAKMMSAGASEFNLA